MVQDYLGHLSLPKIWRNNHCEGGNAIFNGCMSWGKLTGGPCNPDGPWGPFSPSDPGGPGGPCIEISPQMEIGHTCYVKQSPLSLFPSPSPLSPLPPSPSLSLPLSILHNLLSSSKVASNCYCHLPCIPLVQQDLVDQTVQPLPSLHLVQSLRLLPCYLVLLVLPFLLGHHEAQPVRVVPAATKIN